MIDLTPISESSMLFHGLSTIEKVADAIIELIPEWSDDNILEAGRQAVKLEHQAFRIRGACGLELTKRAKHLSGGRGKVDSLGEGQEAVIAQIAKEFRVDSRTIRDDIKIFETFPEEMKSSDFVAAGISRQHLILATQAPDPQAALKICIDKGDGNIYNRRSFAADVNLLKNGISIKVVEDCRWLNYPVSLAAYDRLKVLAEQNSELPGMTLNRIILEV